MVPHLVRLAFSYSLCCRFCDCCLKCCKVYVVLLLLLLPTIASAVTLTQTFLLSLNPFVSATVLLNNAQTFGFKQLFCLQHSPDSES